MRIDLGRWRISVILPPSKYDAAAAAQWVAAWQDIPLEFPLQQRPDWPLAGTRQDTLLLRIEDTTCDAVAWVGLRRHKLRGLAGAWYLHIPKLGVGLPEWALGATLDAVKELAARWWRVARVRVELCLLDYAGDLADVERRAEDMGFRISNPLEYEYTLLVTLPPSSAEGLTPFHRNVLKNARKLERAGHVLRPITELRYLRRLTALYSETMKRTGGEVDLPDMEAVLRCVVAHPTRYRMVGLFKDGASEPKDLLAFRLCGCAGRYAYDLLAASTRMSDDSGQIPMMPAIMLDLFSWASGQGATIFDFGGVVTGDSFREAQVSGVTRFKMQFGDHVIRVGSDLLLEQKSVWSWLDRAKNAVRLLTRIQPKAGPESL